MANIFAWKTATPLPDTQAPRAVQNEKIEKSVVKFVRGAGSHLVQEDIDCFIMKGERTLYFYRLEPPPKEKYYLRWEAEVETYLQNFLDERYLARFINHYSEITVYPGVAIGVAEELQQTYLHFYSQITLLQKFRLELA